MAYVCSATWVASEGREGIVRDALKDLTPASREESGNLYYQVYLDPDEPRVFRIFEVYRDADAFTAHAQSEHFATYALGKAIPELESRTRTFFVTLDD